jgi:hypothetical protein
MKKNIDTNMMRARLSASQSNTMIAPVWTRCPL